MLGTVKNHSTDSDVSATSALLATMTHPQCLICCAACLSAHTLQGYDAWTYTSTRGQRPGGMFAVGDRAAANTGPVARGIRYNAGKDPGPQTSTACTAGRVLSS
jgi:hypothetical protein